jgi:hypothetical protein
LRLLDLSGNKIKSVPFNIYRLKELVTLKLADNPELVISYDELGSLKAVEVIK